MDISRAEALAIVDSLQDGVVPEIGARDVMTGTGYEEYLVHMGGLLDRVASNDLRAAVRFLVGPPGSGKTMLMAIFREMALERGLAITEVAVDPRGDLLSYPEQFFFECMRNLRIPEGPDRDSIGLVLEGLALDILNEVDSDPDIKNPTERIRKVREVIYKRTKNANFPLPSMIDALITYTVAYARNRPDTSRRVLKWFYGEKQNLPTLRGLFLDSRIDRQNAEAALASLISVLEVAGFSGLLVLVDEVERTMELWTDRQRQRAYELLRRVMDRRYDGTVICLALTPILLEDETRGIPSYEALAARMGQVRVTSPGIQGGQLVLGPLGKDELQELLLKVLRINEHAYSWSADDLRALANELTTILINQGKHWPTRAFVKAVCDLIYHARTDEDFRPLSFLKSSE